MDTFDGGNEKRLDTVVATFHFVMTIELNFARRQEQTVISSEMSDYTSLAST